jgi:hypothetical protein
VIVSLDDVNRLRGNVARAHALAAQRFRDAFAESPLPPSAHLEMLAAALLETAEGVRFDGQLPSFANRDHAIFRHFHIGRTPSALLEYWLIVSEIFATSSWAMTRLVATSEEYDEALRRMTSPQIVRAIIIELLPGVEWRDDGTAMLDVTLYTRATEERIERRQLFLDAHQELHFHARSLLAEGRGGIEA